MDHLWELIPKEPWLSVKNLLLRLYFSTVSGICFSIYGIGSLILVLICFPLIALCTRDAEIKMRRTRALLQLCYYVFINIMIFFKIMSLRIVGIEKLRAARNCLIVANHPSLIDIVIILSRLPQADCIVKGNLAHNPFFGRVVQTAYITNDNDLETLLSYCQKSFERGHALVIFPEGTRTKPGHPIEFTRGAANIAVRTGRNVLPLSITCVPPGLYKGQPWYAIPTETMNFTITVGEMIEVAPIIQQNPEPAIAARRLTEEMERRVSGELRVALRQAQGGASGK